MMQIKDVGMHLATQLEKDLDRELSLLKVSSPEFQARARRLLLVGCMVAAKKLHGLDSASDEEQWRAGCVWLRGAGGLEAAQAVRSLIYQAATRLFSTALLIA